MKFIIKIIAMLLKNENTCIHDKITPEMQAGYCPDCGEYIENTWYITRCNCCGLKQQTMFIQNEIRPVENFCKNCGCGSFTVQKLEKINFVDICYAVVIKTITKNRQNLFTQSWVEKPEKIAVKLLTQNGL